MRRALVALLLATSLLALARAGDDGDLLVRLESDDAAVRAAAEEEWDALDEATSVGLARAGLSDPYAPGAVAAADRVSSWSLDLDEQRRQAVALLRAPDVREHTCPASFGAPEVPAVWRTVGGRTAWFAELHRVTGADNLPALLDHAADAPPAQWSDLVWTVNVVAIHTDAHRERAAALFARELRHWPDVDLPRPTRQGSGLPPHFETIARCAWGLEQFADRKLVVSRVVPWSWLMRWAAEITPTAADLPFLDDVVADAGDDPEARAWALRHRVRLSGDGAATWLASLLDDERPDWLTAVTTDEWLAAEIEIAAHLALLGRPGAWKAVLAHDPEAATATPLLWRIDRAAAVRAAAEGEFDLTVLGRARLRAMWGVDVTAADLDDVAARIGADEEGLADLVSFFAQVHPDGLRGPVAQDFAERLKRARADGAHGEHNLDVDDLRIVLGLLEVRSRESLVGVLRAWSGKNPWLRELAVNALVAIDEPVDADVAWRVWTEPNLHIAWEDRSSIGLHPDGSIGERLRALAEKTGERSDEAIAALARRVGLPREAAFGLELLLPEDAGTRDEVLRETLAGRPHTALAILYAATNEVLLVAHLAPDALRELRTHRENQLYWHATLGLALAGDPGACGEIEQTLRENRTQLLDPIASLDGHRFGRQFARLHAERLAHNCCAHFQGFVPLNAAFPTMPIEKSWGRMATQREIALQWLDAHEDNVAWSVIADGWLPR